MFAHSWAHHASARPPNNLNDDPRGGGNAARAHVRSCYVCSASGAKGLGGGTPWRTPRAGFPSPWPFAPDVARFAAHPAATRPGRGPRAWCPARREAATRGRRPSPGAPGAVRGRLDWTPKGKSTSVTNPFAVRAGLHSAERRDKSCTYIEKRNRRSLRSRGLS